jgi:hypothetical protein
VRTYEADAAASGAAGVRAVRSGGGWRRAHGVPRQPSTLQWVRTRRRSGRGRQINHLLGGRPFGEVQEPPTAAGRRLPPIQSNVIATPTPNVSRS